MTSVVVLGGVIAACFKYLNVAVLDKAEAAAQAAAATGGMDLAGSQVRQLLPSPSLSLTALLSLLAPPSISFSPQVKKLAPKKKKPSMSFGESARYLASSKYIRNLATLVIAYGMSINLVEVTHGSDRHGNAAPLSHTLYPTARNARPPAIPFHQVTWKGKLKQAFPNPTEYSAFMGSFSSATGVVTLFMMLFGRFVFRKWGECCCSPAALCHPSCSSSFSFSLSFSSFLLLWFLSPS